MPAPDFPIESLLTENERLPGIRDWLTDQVFSPERYASLPLAEYLREGEAAVCRLEEIITTGAPKVWDELVASVQSAPSPRAWLGLDEELPSAQNRAVVVFDGLSLRELPLLLAQAHASGLRVKKCQVIATCVPTETVAFVEQRVVGKETAPSRLPGNALLASHNTDAFYLDQPNMRDRYPSGRSLLLWSTYPDRLFKNDEARFEDLFATFHEHHIPTLWKNTVQSLPPGLPTVITSDHGYIFFGNSLESSRASNAAALMGQSRQRRFGAEEEMPAAHPDLQLFPAKRLALLRGRIRARAQGAGSRRLYQHEGFSLLEVLVPWIELEPR
ncbi:MAG: hypothetical protein WC003_02905 [Terrimicrobiaceae bacterium]